MPNTLAHVGVHLPLTRALVRGADAKWIYLGCVIPDVPWILQRVLMALPGIDPTTVRLHAGAQSSLVGSLLLAAAMACLACRPRRAFTVLGIGVLAHLLLDACQIKWGNGSMFFAPFDWRLVRVDLFWPEHWATYALTAIGLAVFGVEAVRAGATGVIDVSFRPLRRIVIALVALALWASWPVPFRESMLASDAYSLATLRAPDRIGRRIAMDRVPYTAPPRGPAVHTLTHERLALTEAVSAYDAVLSLRGTFVDSATIRVDAYHDHTTGHLRVPIRDVFSYAGLLLVASTWLVALERQRRRSRRRVPALP